MRSWIHAGVADADSVADPGDVVEVPASIRYLLGWDFTRMDRHE
jgi:hypothetical protein